MEGTGLTTNRHKAFEDDADILHPNCGGGYMTECVSQDAYTKGVNFIAFML